MNPSRLLLVCASIASTLLATGCASVMSGLDGSSTYGCKAPDGVKCDSVAGTYYNSIQNNLPAQRRPGSQGSSEAPAVAPRPTAVMIQTSSRIGAASAEAFQGAPLRAAPRVWRLWIKPWEDADRDLNDESLVYVQVDNGRWLVDHVQRQAREPYAPVRPAKVPTTSAAASGSKPAPSGPQRPGPSQPGEQADDSAAVSQALRALQGRPAGEEN